MAPFETLELMLGRLGSVLVADVELLPPHPVIADAIAARDRT
jgi:hypothetical protein